MKYLIIILFGLGMAFPAQAQVSKADDFKVVFNDTIIDLGSVIKGEKASETFTFINHGSEAVQIDLVSSCECTTLDWSRGKIMPNEEGFIQFTFDSSSKDEPEVIDIEIFFMNKDEEGEPRFRIINYKYDLARP